MQQLSRGQRLPLTALIAQPSGALRMVLGARGLALDFACFGLDAAGRLADERYMTFFNQPRTPCGGVTIAPAGDGSVSLAFELARLPSSIDQLVITVSVDGDGAMAQTMAQIQAGWLQLFDGVHETARFDYTGADFVAERALMLASLYRKDGQWRLMAIGQGFNGGLPALVAHFGGTVADAAPASTGSGQTAAASAPAAIATPPVASTLAATAAPAAAPSPAAVSLEKRVAREAPQLVSLLKHATVSLQKVGLQDHRAKVALVLDISGSMSALYHEGLVQRFADRILALGCKFDDDGEIDVFLFGRDVHQPDPMRLSNAANYVQQLMRRHRLEGDTRYGRAIEAVRRFYFPDSDGGERRAPLRAQLPVYVMFVTDGGTSDQPLTEKQLRWSSREPIFWQFMGIGKGRKSRSKRLALFAHSDFPFLEKLDDLDGRLIDNANYFSVSSPDEHDDAQLYDLLMTEYPGWLKLARQHGLLGT